MEIAVYRTRNQRIVCAAMRNSNGKIIASPRHWDPIAHQAVKHSTENWDTAEQGFLTNYAEFVSREEAYKIAIYHNQITRSIGYDTNKLYSEHLY